MRRKALQQRTSSPTPTPRLASRRRAGPSSQREEGNAPHGPSARARGAAFDFSRISTLGPREGAGAGPVVQAKLEISTPGDRYEQEADRIADAFMRSAGTANAQPLAGSPLVQRKCAQCEKDDEPKKVQRKSAGPDRDSEEHEGQPRVEEHVQAATRGGGQPLPASARAQFEPYFGHDFSRVRVHTDDGATKAMNAQAFTVGRDIVFRAGQYQPDSTSGRHLLAHELTHVVQQQATGSPALQRAEEMPAAAAPTPAPAAPAPEPAKEEAPAAPAACALTTYSGSNFTGKAIVADVEFVDSLDAINAHAVDHNVKVYITDSFREAGGTVSGAIVPPAEKSNHLAGHAIDMNVQSGSTFCNSGKLKKSELPNQPQPVQAFIKSIQDDPGLRWGGDFGDEDPVHIDDNLNSDTAAWDARYKATQQSRKDKCG